MSIGINVGVLGVGAAGNNIASLASENKFKSIALNTSHLDMESLHNDCVSIIMGDEGGAGKDRETPKAIIEERWQDLVSEITPVFNQDGSECEVIVVVGSTGGGTASGAIPMLTELLKATMPGKRFVVGLIFPSANESVHSQINTINCMLEIKELGVPVFIYDNQKVKGSVKTVFDTINASVVSDLCFIRGDYRTPSEYGNIDDKDMINIISQTGYIHFSKIRDITESALDVGTSVDDLIFKAIKESLCADMNRDKKVGGIGLAYSLPDTVFETNDESYVKTKDIIGEPETIFTNPKISSTDETGYIYTCLGGLSFPEVRLSQMQKIVNDKRRALETGRDSRLDKIGESVAWADKSGTTDRREKAGTNIVAATEIDASSIFKKFKK